MVDEEEQRKPCGEQISEPVRPIVDKKEPTKAGTNAQRKEPTMPELEDVLSCNVCDFDTETQFELDNHAKRMHVSIPAPANTTVEKKTESVKPIDKEELTKMMSRNLIL